MRRWCVTMSAGLLLVMGLASSDSHAQYTQVLWDGQSLAGDGTLTSNEGLYRLTFERIFNDYAQENWSVLTVRQVGTPYVLWWSIDDGAYPTGLGSHMNQTSTAALGCGSADMQGDGNFVLYHCNGLNPVWHTSTSSNAGAYLTMQDDSNLVIYTSSNVAIWSTW